MNSRVLRFDKLVECPRSEYQSLSNILIRERQAWEEDGDTEFIVNEILLRSHRDSDYQCVFLDWYRAESLVTICFITGRSTFSDMKVRVLHQG